MATKTLNDLSWAVTAAADVTVVARDADGSVTVLAERPAGARLPRYATRAFVLSGDDAGLLVNGVEVDLGDYYPQFLGLLDEAADHEIGSGYSIDANES